MAARLGFPAVGYASTAAPLLPRSRVAVGHLPHAVARQLAPLLRHGRAVAEAVVQEEPLGEREPVLVELQVSFLACAGLVHWMCSRWRAGVVGEWGGWWGRRAPAWRAEVFALLASALGSCPAASALICLGTPCPVPSRPLSTQVTLLPAAPGASPGAARRTASALDRAEAAAAAQLAAAPRATGERLHANFLSLLDTVQQHDGHLLAEPETALIQAYKVMIRGWRASSAFAMRGRASRRH
jgi:hypothetical protein